MSGQPEAVGEEEPAQRDSFTIQHPASSGGTAVAEALEVLAVHSTSSSNPASGFSFPTLPALSTSTAQQLPLTAQSTVRDASAAASTSQPTLHQQQLPLTARSTVSHASAPLTAQSTVRDASAPLTAQSTVRDASGPPSTSQPAAALQPAVPIVVKAKPDVRRNKDQCTRALYGFLSRFFPVMLEKGYSQMDWLKLGRTNKDLNGLHGAPPQRGITMAEVARHASREDMWMVLRGKVYNVTPYLGFHPGGADVMMKAAGRDGTVLFNKFHPWVNGDALMEKCLVGWLEEKAVADS